MLSDLRVSLRALRANPGYALVAILTLALGIGANAALFAVIDGVLLKGLPFADPARLVRIWSTSVHSPAEFEGVRSRARTLAQVAGVEDGAGMSLTGIGAPERVRGARATASLFATLGARAAIGRALAGGDDRAGASPVVVLSDGMWRERFGADPSVVGRAITLDGVPRTVVGVMPEGFAFPSRETRLWVPVVVDPTNPGAYWGNMSLALVARLRPGATPQRARADVRGIARQLRAENVLWHPDESGYVGSVDVVPLRDAMVGGVRALLLILFAAVGAVLLIACANVANLTLVRAIGRSRELAVRVALGASRARLVRQMLAESIVLALAGAAAGLVLAAWGSRLLTAFLPADVPRLAEVRLDARVVLFAIGVALVTGAALGILPALRAAAGDPADAMRGGARGGRGPGARRLAHGLVVGEIALAVALVAAAGVLARSLLQLTAVSPGFDAERVVAARVDPVATRYRDPARRDALWDALLANAGAIPGVRDAAVTTALPLRGRSGLVAYRVADVRQNLGDLPMGYFESVSPGYFRALGVPLVRGRDFTSADRADAPAVVVVNQALARLWWPGQDPIGKRIGYPWPSDWLTVVGVVGDVKLESLASPDEPAIYAPFAQAAAPMRTASATLVLRVAGGGDRGMGALASAIRRAVAAADPDAPVSAIAPLTSVVRESVARPRITAALLAGFAGIALVLGAVGIYGVSAYAVRQRERELGVRMALGARGSDVRRMVVWESVRLASIGIALGLVLALGTTRLLRAMLFGVAPLDPVTFVGAPLVLASVALLASWAPARRASRVDPMVSMRGD